MDSERRERYEVRDDSYEPIYRHKFCTDCRSKECSNMTHNHIELHPSIRIPKKTANKKKWQTFFDLIQSFGKSNSRQGRH